MSEFSSGQRHCSVFKWRQLGLWGCLVVSRRPILSADASIFCLRAVYVSGEFVSCRFYPNRHHETLPHSSGGTAWSAHDCAVNTLCIILFECFNFHHSFIYDCQVLHLWIQKWKIHTFFLQASRELFKARCSYFSQSVWQTGGIQVL